MHRNVRRIILIRHGESVGNIDASVYGRLPDNQQELTDWGKEQAVNAGMTLASLLGGSDARFFISPYTRSHQTFNIITDVLDSSGVNNRSNGRSWSYVEDPRLREQDWGNFQDLQHMARQQKERKRFGVFYYRFSNGESGADVYDRVSSFMETLCRDSFRSKPSNYVLISHGITIRMFLARYYHWPVETLNKLHNFHNGQIVAMERAKVVGSQYTNVHMPHRMFTREPSFNNTEFYHEDPTHPVVRGFSTHSDTSEEFYAGTRFLLTSLLMSDPPGPPEADIWWEKVKENRKTTSPLLGL